MNGLIVPKATRDLPGVYEVHDVIVLKMINWIRFVAENATKKITGRVLYRASRSTSNFTVDVTVGSGGRYRES